ncbi:DUF6714 family protein [Mitsuaria sp. GD03876]|uniref:DUF6714 family protein n=1 Tax=Mitsuaria sp. GD03876 TaxID=2975399 RepID=UPI0024491853|nr:DUF6714 family protein [Mitsuaria sp. GD03876]MDH0863809.1 hypothetical protein [Mitsuaria sp. GD03876]
MSFDSLHEAFSHRAKPGVLISSTELTEDEVAGVLAIGERDWHELTLDTLEENFDAINLMALEAFIYYLPGVMLATLKEDTRNAITAVTVASMLDRTPNPDLWDSHFLARWPQLNVKELSVVADWIVWLGGSGDFALDETSLIRALENLELLKQDAGQAGRLG